MAKAKTPRTNNRSKANDLPVDAPISPAQMQEFQPELRELKRALNEVRKTIVPINLEEEIRRRAYELYEARGCAPGHETDDWFVAEREVLARYGSENRHTA
ncbi:MAG TPA: DUF2934 domain-containing protein [Terriglobales bacterium]|nr:DUF2934 domain-containing protein [Terriglobales bacterium]